ncbi:hypothetical protein VOLCADRAFT_88228 [Volvox carteri f. nagariensis]|uniref:Uncharacterized protein n=1 Tax=Volvox carteri f. nagariensis TaxID=3068 RepID=D8TNM2_VOLCA|nr:uncharacterized protein VOLCADRAFT_88228 [Volvox carteri f. nagariensis]EFJ50869.1 hypothetical protein VOLCADRAFT_88228 [Volvox carteri f. nagariensis]|eukprot:XP_002947881.1 hypothetical protein VOLCADRAFT_88228 [Volvox carteri f. nagariensis]
MTDRVLRQHSLISVGPQAEALAAASGTVTSPSPGARSSITRSNSSPNISVDASGKPSSGLPGTESLQSWAKPAGFQQGDQAAQAGVDYTPHQSPDFAESPTEDIVQIPYHQSKEFTVGVSAEALGFTSPAINASNLSSASKALRRESRSRIITGAIADTGGTKQQDSQNAGIGSRFGGQPGISEGHRLRLAAAELALNSLATALGSRHLPHGTSVEGAVRAALGVTGKALADSPPGIPPQSKMHPPPQEALMGGAAKHAHFMEHGISSRGSSPDRVTGERQRKLAKFGSSSGSPDRREDGTQRPRLGTLRIGAEPDAAAGLRSRSDGGGIPLRGLPSRPAASALLSIPVAHRRAAGKHDGDSRTVSKVNRIFLDRSRCESSPSRSMERTDEQKLDKPTFASNGNGSDGADAAAAAGAVFLKRLARFPLAAARMGAAAASVDARAAIAATRAASPPMMTGAGSLATSTASRSSPSSVGVRDPARRSPPGSPASTPTAGLASVHQQGSTLMTSPSASEPGKEQPTSSPRLGYASAIAAAAGAAVRSMAAAQPPREGRYMRLLSPMSPRSISPGATANQQSISGSEWKPTAASYRTTQDDRQQTSFSFALAEATSPRRSPASAGSGLGRQPVAASRLITPLHLLRDAATSPDRLVGTEPGGRRYSTSPSPTRGPNSLTLKEPRIHSTGSKGSNVPEPMDLPELVGITKRLDTLLRQVNSTHSHSEGTYENVTVSDGFSSRASLLPVVMMDNRLASSTQIDAGAEADKAILRQLADIERDMEGLISPQKPAVDKLMSPLRESLGRSPALSPTRGPRSTIEPPSWSSTTTATAIALSQTLAALQRTTRLEAAAVNLRTVRARASSPTRTAAVVAATAVATKHATGSECNIGPPRPPPTTSNSPPKRPTMTEAAKTSSGSAAGLKTLAAVQSKPMARIEPLVLTEPSRAMSPDSPRVVRAGLMVAMPTAKLAAFDWERIFAEAAGRSRSTPRIYADIRDVGRYGHSGDRKSRNGTRLGSGDGPHSRSVSVGGSYSPHDLVRNNAQLGLGALGRAGGHAAGSQVVPQRSLGESGHYGTVAAAAGGYSKPQTVQALVGDAGGVALGGPGLQLLSALDQSALARGLSHVEFQARQAGQRSSPRGTATVDAAGLHRPQDFYPTSPAGLPSVTRMLWMSPAAVMTPKAPSSQPPSSLSPLVYSPREDTIANFGAGKRVIGANTSLSIILASAGREQSRGRNPKSVLLTDAPGLTTSPRSDHASSPRPTHLAHGGTTMSSAWVAPSTPAYVNAADSGGGTAIQQQTRHKRAGHWKLPPPAAMVGAVDGATAGAVVGTGCEAARNRVHEPDPSLLRVLQQLRSSKLSGGGSAACGNGSNGGSSSHLVDCGSSDGGSAISITNAIGGPALRNRGKAQSGHRYGSCGERCDADMANGKVVDAPRSSGSFNAAVLTRPDPARQPQGRHRPRLVDVGLQCGQPASALTSAGDWHDVPSAFQSLHEESEDSIARLSEYSFAPGLESSSSMLGPAARPTAGSGPEATGSDSDDVHSQVGLCRNLRGEVNAAFACKAENDGMDASPVAPGAYGGGNEYCSGSSKDGKGGGSSDSMGGIGVPDLPGSRIGGFGLVLPWGRTQFAESPGGADSEALVDAKGLAPLVAEPVELGLQTVVPLMPLMVAGSAMGVTMAGHGSIGMEMELFSCDVTILSPGSSGVGSIKTPREVLSARDADREVQPDQMDAAAAAPAKPEGCEVEEAVGVLGIPARGAVVGDPGVEVGLRLPLLLDVLQDPSIKAILPASVVAEQVGPALAIDGGLSGNGDRAASPRRGLPGVPSTAPRCKTDESPCNPPTAIDVLTESAALAQPPRALVAPTAWLEMDADQVLVADDGEYSVKGSGRTSPGSSNNSSSSKGPRKADIEAAAHGSSTPIPGADSPAAALPWPKSITTGMRPEMLMGCASACRPSSEDMDTGRLTHRDEVAAAGNRTEHEAASATASLAVCSNAQEPSGRCTVSNAGAVAILVSASMNSDSSQEHLQRWMRTPHSAAAPPRSWQLQNLVQEQLQQQPLLQPWQPRTDKLPSDNSFPSSGSCSFRAACTQAGLKAQLGFGYFAVTEPEAADVAQRFSNTRKAGGSGHDDDNGDNAEANGSMGSGERSGRIEVADGTGGDSDSNCHGARHGAEGHELADVHMEGPGSFSMGAKDTSGCDDRVQGGDHKGHISSCSGAVKACAQPRVKGVDIEHGMQASPGFGGEGSSDGDVAEPELPLSSLGLSEPHRQDTCDADEAAAGSDSSPVPARAADSPSSASAPTPGPLPFVAVAQYRSEETVVSLSSSASPATTARHCGCCGEEHAAGGQDAAEDAKREPEPEPDFSPDLAKCRLSREASMYRRVDLIAADVVFPVCTDLTGYAVVSNQIAQQPQDAVPKQAKPATATAVSASPLTVCNKGAASLRGNSRQITLLEPAGPPHRPPEFGAPEMDGGNDTADATPGIIDDRLQAGVRLSLEEEQVQHPPSAPAQPTAAVAAAGWNPGWITPLQRRLPQPGGCRSIDVVVHATPVPASNAQLATPFGLHPDGLGAMSGTRPRTVNGAPPRYAALRESSESPPRRRRHGSVGPGKMTGGSGAASSCLGSGVQLSPASSSPSSQSEGGGGDESSAALSNRSLEQDGSPVQSGCSVCAATTECEHVAVANAGTAVDAAVATAANAAANESMGAGTMAATATAEASTAEECGSLVIGPRIPGFQVPDPTDLRHAPATCPPNLVNRVPDAPLAVVAAAPAPLAATPPLLGSNQQRPGHHGHRHPVGQLPQNSYPRELHRQPGLLHMRQHQDNDTRAHTPLLNGSLVPRPARTTDDGADQQSPAVRVPQLAAAAQGAMQINRPPHAPVAFSPQKHHQHQQTLLSSKMAPNTQQKQQLQAQYQQPLRKRQCQQQLQEFPSQQQLHRHLQIAPHQDHHQQQYVPLAWPPRPQQQHGIAPQQQQQHHVQLAPPPPPPQKQQIQTAMQKQKQRLPQRHQEQWLQQGTWTETEEQPAQGFVAVDPGPGRSSSSLARPAAPPSLGVAPRTVLPSPHVEGGGVLPERRAAMANAASQLTAIICPPRLSSTLIGPLESMDASSYEVSGGADYKGWAHQTDARPHIHEERHVFAGTGGQGQGSGLQHPPAQEQAQEPWPGLMHRSCVLSPDLRHRGVSRSGRGSTARMGKEDVWHGGKGLLEREFVEMQRVAGDVAGRSAGGGVHGVFVATGLPAAAVGAAARAGVTQALEGVPMAALTHPAAGPLQAQQQQQPPAQRQASSALVASLRQLNSATQSTCARMLELYYHKTDTS